MTQWKYVICRNKLQKKLTENEVGCSSGFQFLVAFEKKFQEK